MVGQSILWSRRQRTRHSSGFAEHISSGHNAHHHPFRRPQRRVLDQYYGNRAFVLNFKGEDAVTVIDTIDKVSRSRLFMPTTAIHPSTFPFTFTPSPNELFCLYILEMRTIIADIQKERSKGMDVVVKTLRKPQESNIGPTHRARKAFRYHPLRLVNARYRIQAFCKGCVVWMNTSHPNILPFLAVKMKPDSGKFSTISKMVTNGNILRYINDKRENRIRLVQPFGHRCSGLNH